MKFYDAIIIGGGASGMMCALWLSKVKKFNVLLLERNDRLGKKLSATGNGQGNVTNVTLSVDNYFTSEPDKVKNVLNAFDEKALINYLSDLGGMFIADNEGRVYPSSKQASSVTDILRLEIGRRKNIDVVFSSFVVSAKKSGNVFIVNTCDNSYSCLNLVVAAGGKAAKHFGTDGNAYAIAKNFNHSVTKLTPSLVQIKTPVEYIKGMKGVRSECEVSLYKKDEFIKSVRGDVIFTDYGVSGNAIFKLSSYLTENDVIKINFLPDIDKQTLLTKLNKKVADNSDLLLEQLLYAVLNNSIARSLIKYCNLNGSSKCDTSAVCKIVDAINSFSLEVTGTLGFDYAQVTKGGVLTEEVDENLMSKKCNNLYFIGEILNVDGECGGYNLQWAFSSAVAAARNILNR